jgi:hypothetical protein
MVWLSSGCGFATQAFIRAKYEARTWAAGDWPPPEALAEPKQVCAFQWSNSTSHRKPNRPWPEQAGLTLQRMLRMLRKFAFTFAICRERHISPLCSPLHLVVATMRCLLRQQLLCRRPSPQWWNSRKRTRRRRKHRRGQMQMQPPQLPLLLRRRVRAFGRCSGNWPRRQSGGAGGLI